MVNVLQLHSLTAGPVRLPHRMLLRAGLDRYAEIYPHNWPKLFFCRKKVL